MSVGHRRKLARKRAAYRVIRRTQVHSKGMHGDIMGYLAHERCDALDGWFLSQL